jgi:hypothetical protein
MKRIPFDAQFIAECDAIPAAACDALGPGACETCPAWEGLKQRNAAPSPPSPAPTPEADAPGNHEPEVKE